MDVTREDVLRCAALAHLGLEESEIEPLREAMQRMLERAASLDTLDLTGVEPMPPGLGRTLQRREDEVRPSLSQEAALANAPATRRGCFEVPKVL